MAALPPQPPPPEPPQPPAYPPPLPVAPQPGVYAGQVPPPAYAGMYGYAVPYSLPAVPRQRTGLIVLAQVLMVVKGVFWLIAGLGTIAVGIYLIVHGGDLHALPGYRDQPGLNAAATGLVGVATGFIIAVAVALLAIGIADIALGITVGRLSNVARWLTVALDVVAGIVALSSLIGQLNHRPTAGGAVFAAAWLVTNIVIFYALVIDPRSRQAFG